jgi:hypothetical protein
MRRSSIRATRVGGSASTELDRGAKPVARQRVEYWCANDHRTTTQLAAGVEAPATWDCDTCGAPAVQERGTAPQAAREGTFYRTPYEFLMMRRTPEDGERLLAEALERLEQGRNGGHS